jgi:putative peptide zinc metalloprotease protein
VLKLFYRTPIVVLCLSAFIAVECLVMPKAFNSFGGVFRVFTFREFFLFYSVIVGSMLIHELGHASACRHYKCPHGSIGFGLYIIFPGFYTDVTKAWRLPRLRRTVVNLGGLYFQCIVIVCVGGYAWLYGSQFWLRVVWITNFMMLHTLNPVLKQDGYWVLSDLSGLRNLHKQVRQTAARLFNKAMGKAGDAPSGNDRLRLRVLYIYTLLVAVYCLYFVNFIYHALWEIALYYPPLVAIFGRTLAAAWSHGRWLDFLLILLRFLWESLLPMLVLLLVSRMLYKVARHIGRRAPAETN